jgi:hypothetical protein
VANLFSIWNWNLNESDDHDEDDPPFLEKDTLVSVEKMESLS